MQKFSQRLISLRKERDLTQNDLARIIKNSAPLSPGTRPWIRSRISRSSVRWLSISA